MSAVLSDSLPVTVVVGAGLAAWSLVRELRQRDVAMPLTVICADSGDFYSKPMLSNALAMKKTPETLLQTAAVEQARKFNVTLLPFTSVESIEREQKRVTTSAGEVFYTNLVLALGADPIRLCTPGIEHSLTVNDLVDYGRFRQALEQRGTQAKIVILGAGLIGSEFANDLAHVGYSVSIVDPGCWPLSRLLTQAQGKEMQSALEALGVRYYFEQTAQSIVPAPEGYWVGLTSGERIAADLVLSAVGLQSRTKLAQQAGLTVSRGIVVNRYGRTEDPHIYALGDCAAYIHTLADEHTPATYRVMPYVLPLMSAAKALAGTLTGTPKEIEFAAWSVRVKTPAYPVAIATA